MSFQRWKWNEVRWRLTPCVSVILNLCDLVLGGDLVSKGFCKEGCKGLLQILEKRFLNRNF